MSCTGQCCSAFNIDGNSVDSFKAWASLMQEKSRDMVYIADMLLPVTAAVIDHPVYGSYQSNDRDLTCRHWDRATGLCSDYANRPAMCKDYPYKKHCSWCGTPGPEYASKVPFIDNYYQGAA